MAWIILLFFLLTVPKLELFQSWKPPIETSTPFLYNGKAPNDCWVQRTWRNDEEVFTNGGRHFQSAFQEQPETAYHNEPGYQPRQCGPQNASIYANSVTSPSSRSLRSKSHSEILIWWTVSARMSWPHTLWWDYSPCHRTLYRKSTTTSLSIIPILLKCFRTEFASWSLLCRRSSFRLAIVGDIFPIGERESTSWLYDLLKAAGVFNR